MKGHAARHRAVALVAAATVVATAGGVTSVAASPAEAAGVCPKLYVLGVQGTGQSSSDASPTTDSGMLSAVMKPL